jgi:hypothetical protein
MRTPLSPRERGWLIAALYATALALLNSLWINAVLPWPNELIVTPADQNPAAYTPLPNLCTTFPAHAASDPTPPVGAMLETYDRNKVRCFWTTEPGTTPAITLTLQVQRPVNPIDATTPAATYAATVQAARRQYHEAPGNRPGDTPITPVSGIGDEAKLTVSSTHRGGGHAHLVTRDGMLLITIDYSRSDQDTHQMQTIAQRLAAELLRTLPPQGA